MQKIAIICSDQFEAKKYWYSHKLISKKYTEINFQKLPKLLILKPNCLNIFLGISYREMAAMDILRIEKEQSFVIAKNFTSDEVKKLNHTGWGKIIDMNKKLFLKVLERHIDKLQCLSPELTIHRVSKQIGLTEKECRML
ncbi:MAG: hypothetical protein CO099_13760, partial [Bdellovibrio sp. CG_4_9_14_3_um_filter_39_7]